MNVPLQMGVSHCIPLRLRPRRRRISELKVESWIVKVLVICHATDENL